MCLFFALRTNGITKSKASNARDTKARRECLEHYGSTKCQICGFDSGLYYGEDFKGLIHVHHVIPISERGGEYRLNPQKDLLPVCPNCHMILHSSNGKKYDWQQLKGFFESHM